MLRMFRSCFVVDANSAGIPRSLAITLCVIYTRALDTFVARTLGVLPCGERRVMHVAGAVRVFLLENIFLAPVFIKHSVALVIQRINQLSHRLRR